MDITCKFCGSQQFKEIFEAPSFDDHGKQFLLARCDHCKIVRTAPMLAPAELDEYYRSHYYGQDGKKFLPMIESFTRLNNHLRAKSILTMIEESSKSPGEQKRILDIGCGRANLLKALKKMGVDVYGVEKDGFKFPNDLEDIRVFTGEVEEQNFPSDFFDAVIFWHSFEHLQNPKQILGEAGRIIKRGGLMVIAAPNFESTQRKLFKRFWFHLDLPRHCYHYSAAALSDQLSSKGFNISKVTTFSFEQNPYGFIQSCLNWLVPSQQPNKLYSLLKARKNRGEILELLFWVIGSGLLFPFSILEYIVSGIIQKGAVFTVYGVKT